MRELLLHLCPVVLVEHVDEVHQNDAAQVAQPQLTGNGLRGLEVHFKHGLGKTAAADEPTGVDIDNGHSLGLVDDEIAPALEIDPAPQGLLNLLLNVVQLKERPFPDKVLEPAEDPGHVLLGEDAKAIDAIGVVHQHPRGLFADPVAQHPLG